MRVVAAMWFLGALASAQQPPEFRWSATEHVAAHRERELASARIGLQHACRDHGAERGHCRRLRSRAVADVGHGQQRLEAPEAHVHEHAERRGANHAALHLLTLLQVFQPHGVGDQDRVRHVEGARVAQTGRELPEHVLEHGHRRGLVGERVEAHVGTCARLGEERLHVGAQLLGHAIHEPVVLGVQLRAVTQVGRGLDAHEAHGLLGHLRADAIDRRELGLGTKRRAAVAPREEGLGTLPVEARRVAKHVQRGRVRVVAGEGQRALEDVVHHALQARGADVEQVGAQAQGLRLDLGQLVERVLEATRQRECAALVGRDLGAIVDLEVALLLARARAAVVDLHDGSCLAR